MLTISALGLLGLGVFYTLYIGQAIILPILFALLFDRVLKPVVLFLRNRGVPAALGAGLVMAAVAAVLAASVYNLSDPAERWMAEAPSAFIEAETKLRRVIAPVEQVQEAARRVEEAAQGAVGGRRPPVTLQRTSFAEAMVGQTQAFLVGGVTAFFLLYFLLAAGDNFLRTFVRVLPHLKEQRKAVEITHRIEEALSKYLLTVAAINTALGFVVGAAFLWLGMPNPVLWGIMVAVLNFIPYLGPLVGVALIAVVGLVSFDTLMSALLPPLAYFIINAIEGYLVTPFIMGRRLTLNPVFIFISLLFWGWMWGIAGALLAVPLLVTVKIVCDNIEPLQPLGAFLG